MFFGSASWSAGVDWTLEPVADDHFGAAVGTAGDVNGDGYADVIVGAPGRLPSSTGGRAYVYFGGASPDAVADLVPDGRRRPATVSAARSAAAGDVNGDGYDDVVVGANGNDAGGTGAGRAYVYFGGPAMDADGGHGADGRGGGRRLRLRGGAAGDVNGDGYDDVVVGALTNDAGAVGRGAGLRLLRRDGCRRRRRPRADRRRRDGLLRHDRWPAAGT